MTTAWTTGVRSLTKAEYFSPSLCVQTQSGAHSTPVKLVLRFFLGVKRGVMVTLTTHPYLAPMLRMSRSYYHHSPQSAYIACRGWALLFTRIFCIMLVVESFIFERSRVWISDIVIHCDWCVFVSSHRFRMTNFVTYLRMYKFHNI